MTKRARQSRHESLRKKRKQEPEEPEAAAELPTPQSISDPDSQNCEDDNIATHPKSFDHHHVERLQEFTNDLHQALQGSLPPRTCPYTAVHVLLLRWDEDDLGVHREISRLRSVFQNQFRFEVEEWNIPSSDPYHSLQDKIFHLQKSHQTSSELLIVYYGGHSDPDTRRGRSIWHANLSATSPSLEWFNIQPILLTAKPYVLMILDCCFAANAARDTTEGSSKELLAACGRENLTLGVGMRSFTSVLIEELQSFEGAAFTVAMLHARLITLRHKLAYTPIYAALAEKGGNSIVISPLPKTHSPSPKGSESPTGPGSKTGIGPPEIPSSVSLNESTRVLLAVSVAEDVAHNVAQWVSWLTTAAPWDVSKVDVRLECMYKSHSTLLLVSMPIVGWSRLPGSPAYRFIGFIKSGNLICEKTNPGPIAVKNQRPVSDDALFSKIPRKMSRLNKSKPYKAPGAGFDRTWTPEDDTLLISAHRQKTPWQEIASKYFPDETAYECRERYKGLKERASLYNVAREEIWKPFADSLGENWQIVEAQYLREAPVFLQQTAWGSSNHSRLPPIDFYRPPIPYEQPTPAPKPKKKRSSRSEGNRTEGSPMMANQTMQQQQSTFPSANTLSPSGASTLQTVPSTSSGERPRKKRGRPSKEELDKRVAEAAQRGEVYLPPRKRKPPRPSTENIVQDAFPQVNPQGPRY